MKTIPLILIALAFICASHAQENKENRKDILHGLMERARDAKAAGKHDEARELAAQAEKLQRELQGREGGKKPEKHPGGGEEQRLHHMLEAVEHLRAAGLHDPASHIEEIARNTRRELEERMRQEHAGRHPSPQAAELGEMRRQMRQMAEKIEQLHAELRRRVPEKPQP